MAVVLAQAAPAATPNTAEVILFWVFAVIGLGAGIAMVSMRNIVHSALMLVVNLLAIAALYLGLQSSFLSIIQVIVYAGAIMVLFLFVIMLLGVDRDDLLVDVRIRHRVFAILAAAGVAAVLLFVVAGTYTGTDSLCGAQAPAGVSRTHDSQPCVGMDDALAATETGSPGVVAERLFTRYTFPFEVSAVLLTVATIGAMLLGRRNEVPQDEEPAFAPSAAVPGAGDVERELAAVSVTREDVHGEDALLPGDLEDPFRDRLPQGDASRTHYGLPPEAGGPPAAMGDESPADGIDPGASGGTTTGPAATPPTEPVEPVEDEAEEEDR